MSKKIFVTGTGTDVGKTFVSGLIQKKLHDANKSCGYYKAAISGNSYDSNGILIPGDADYVRRVSGVSQSTESMCPYVYEAAVSPHLAARMENKPIDIDIVKRGFEKVCETYDYVTMEGSGGILCPLVYDKKKLLLWELIKELNLSAIIVADAGLGTINNVGLTAMFMKSKDINVKGIVFNHYHKGNEMEEDNIVMCEKLTGIRTIAKVTDNDTELDIDVEYLASLYDE